jgi:hypothetical protein
MKTHFTGLAVAALLVIGPTLPAYAEDAAAPKAPAAPTATHRPLLKPQRRRKPKRRLRVCRVRRLRLKPPSRRHRRLPSPLHRAIGATPIVTTSGTVTTAPPIGSRFQSTGRIFTGTGSAGTGSPGSVSDGSACQAVLLGGPRSVTATFKSSSGRSSAD